MKQIYDFSAYQPPVVTEQMLQKERRQRQLRKHTLLLIVASKACHLGLVLFAFFIVAESIVLALISIWLLGLSLIGNGILTILFCRKDRLKKIKFI